MPNEPFTPMQALDALASVASYRERLTAQAAGIVWMAWGITLALLGLVVYVLLGHFDGTRGLPFEALWFGCIAACAAAGGWLTNAVWRAHALEASPGHPRWVPYVTAFGVLSASLILALATGLFPVLQIVWSGPGFQGLVYAGLGLPGAAAAATIAILQARRVSPVPGLVLAAVLTLAMLLGHFLVWPQTGNVDMFGALAFCGLTLVGFFATGIWTMRRR